MNWKLIFKLSLFGVLIGLLTTFFIRTEIEMWFWLGAYAISVAVIIKNTAKYRFGHAWMVALLGGVWSGVIHGLLITWYSVLHLDEMLLMAGLPISPRFIVMLIGPAIGAFMGISLGMICWMLGFVFDRTRPQRSK